MHGASDGFMWVALIFLLMAGLTTFNANSRPYGNIGWLGLAFMVLSFIVK
jgi:hypothetical protein